MNLEAINKWLDEEYGCSYTKLEELHNFYFEKYCDLKQENQRQKEVINKAIKWTIKYQTEWCQEDEVIRDLKQLLDILKEVSE